MKLPKQEYTTEFKEQAAAQVASGRGIAAIARELDVSEQTMRNWVKAAKASKLAGAGAKVITPEQMELSRLRAEVMRLKRETEILKKATVNSTGRRNTFDQGGFYGTTSGVDA